MKVLVVQFRPFPPVLRHSQDQIFYTAPLLPNTFSRHSSVSARGQVYRRRGCEGPEGEQRCSCTLSLTSALGRIGWSKPLLGRFTAGGETSTHFTRCWVRPRVRVMSPPPGFDPRTVQPVASRYTDYTHIKQEAKL